MFASGLHVLFFILGQLESQYVSFTQISCETKQFVAYGPFVIGSNFFAHISAYKYCKYFVNLHMIDYKDENSEELFLESNSCFKIWNLDQITFK